MDEAEWAALQKASAEAWRQARIAECRDLMKKHNISPKELESEIITPTVSPETQSEK